MIFNLCLGYRVDGQRQLPQSRQGALESSRDSFTSVLDTMLP